jgi:hypothetical protein
MSRLQGSHPVGCHCTPFTSTQINTVALSFSRLSLAYSQIRERGRSNYLCPCLLPCQVITRGTISRPILSHRQSCFFCVTPAATHFPGRLGAGPVMAPTVTSRSALLCLLSLPSFCPHFYKAPLYCQAWWHTPTILALGRQRQKDLKGKTRPAWGT